MPSLQSRPASTLSSGERKRLMLALGLLIDPVLLVSDEWAAHLDSNWMATTAELFEDYSERGGAHIGLLSSPDNIHCARTQDLHIEHANRSPDPLSRQSTVSADLRLFISLLSDLPPRPPLSLPKPLDARVRYSRIHRKFLHFEVAPGELAQVVGPNGVGKTTLLKNLWRLSRPINRWRRFSISLPLLYFLQADPAYQVLGPTIGDELSRAFGYYPNNSSVLQEIIRSSLTDKVEQDVLTLSFGERKLLAIIAAVFSSCPALAIDEPTEGLDASNTNAVVKLLQTAQRLGKTVITASHDPLPCPGSILIRLEHAS